jgi:2-iminobutanoate/2-iminopropanoate deaminase
MKEKSMTGENTSKKTILSTVHAPAAIGHYAQAVLVAHQLHKVIYTSGQIGLDPATVELVKGGIEAETRQAFANLSAVAKEAGATLANAVKLTLYLTDLADFAKVNAIMAELVPQPFPARSTVGVASLPKGAVFEVEAILVL